MSTPRLRPGDRVALLLPGSPRYVVAATALLRHGIFPVPMDPSLTASEREPLLAELDPAQVVRDETALERLLRDHPDDPDLGPPRGRPIHLTSGTTGRPKGVWSGLLSREHAEALLAEERELWRFSPTDVNLVLSPMHHSAPLRFAMGTHLAGGTVVAPGPFDPATVTRTITEHRPTTMFCVPAHLQRLFAHWEDVGTPDLRCFRLVAHAGAPCPERVKRRLVEAFEPLTTWEFYGSTEGQFTACRSEEWLRRPGTLGPARPDRSMRADEAGVLWCVVPPHARFEYWRAPEKTAAAWRETAEGPAFSVGDLGRVDEEGHVWLEGRREDLVISGGVNVYPAEVERVLGAVRGVEDVAVFGRDDPQWGQRVCAAVVGTATEAQLRAHARAHLAPAKRPKEYRRLERLPRTATGKVRRLELAGSPTNEGALPSS